MSLDDVVVDPLLERIHYYQLSKSELEKLEDAEALFERGRRLRLGIDEKTDEVAGWILVIDAARLGHPVALAFCFLFGRGTTKNLERAVQLCRTSAVRGHVVGLLLARFACLQAYVNQPRTVWEYATRTEEALRRMNEKLFVGFALLSIGMTQRLNAAWHRATRTE